MGEVKNATIGTDPRAVPSAADRSPEGVDLTLIRWMLSLTPTERLESLQSLVRSLHELRDGVRPS